MGAAISAWFTGRMAMMAAVFAGTTAMLTQWQALADVQPFVLKASMQQQSVEQSLLRQLDKIDALEQGAFVLQNQLPGLRQLLDQSPGDIGLQRQIDATTRRIDKMESDHEALKCQVMKLPCANLQPKP